MDLLQGRVAFVTGGANGIGLELARGLASEGMSVAIADVDGQAAERAAAELRASGGRSVGVRLDVRNFDAFQGAAERVERELGPVDLLCSNAGVASAESIAGQTLIENISLDEWSYILAINLSGHFNAVKTFLPRFKGREREAHILATASMAGIVPQSAFVPGAYTVPKYGAAGLFEQLRLELEPFPRIGLTMLCPGVVRTSIQKNTLAAASYLDERLRSTASNNPYAVDGEMSFGMEARNVAAAAIAAVKQGRFYAFTHPEYAPMVRSHHRTIEAAFGESAQPGYADPLG